MLVLVDLLLRPSVKYFFFNLSTLPVASIMFKTRGMLLTRGLECLRRNVFENRLRQSSDKLDTGSRQLQQQRRRLSDDGMALMTSNTDIHSEILSNRLLRTDAHEIIEVVVLLSSPAPDCHDTTL